MARTNHRSTRSQLAQRLELVLAELAKGTSMADIAAKHGRHPSTLGRQVRAHNSRVDLLKEKQRRKQMRARAQQKRRETQRQREIDSTLAQRQREIDSILARLEAEESETEEPDDSETEEPELE
ncbi:hypothetical protein Gpo141_00008986 [Globisporangium polare]